MSNSPKPWLTVEDETPKMLKLTTSVSSPEEAAKNLYAVARFIYEGPQWDTTPDGVDYWEMVHLALLDLIRGLGYDPLTIFAPLPTTYGDAQYCLLNAVMWESTPQDAAFWAIVFKCLKHLGAVPTFIHPGSCSATADDHSRGQLMELLSFLLYRFPWAATEEGYTYWAGVFADLKEINEFIGGDPEVAEPPIESPAFVMAPCHAGDSLCSLFLWGGHAKGADYWRHVQSCLHGLDLTASVSVDTGRYNRSQNTPLSPTEQAPTAAMVPATTILEIPPAGGLDLPVLSKPHRWNMPYTSKKMPEMPEHEQRSGHYHRGPLTQKARGIYFLRHGYFMRLRSVGVTSIGVRHRVYIYPYEYDIIFPVFARPCPLRPRHGFVDSHQINNGRELLYFLDEVKTVDPEAEIVFMDPLHGHISAVATNAGVSWGFGPAGATEGTEAQSIPTNTSVSAWHSPFLGELMQAVGIEHCMYLEIVEHEGQSCCVQVRDGPAQRPVSNFIPADTEVKAVLGRSDTGEHKRQLTSELLAWEALVEQRHEEVGEGLIIHLPRGSLSSHFAVHGIQRGIPVITSVRQPKVGQLLKAKSGVKVKPLRAEDYHDLADLVAYFLTQPQQFFLPGTSDGDANHVVTTIAVLHACSIWGPTPHLLALRAFAVAMCLRYMTAACIAEARHFFSNGPGAYDFKNDCPEEDQDEDYEYLDANHFRDCCLPWKALASRYHFYIPDSSEETSSSRSALYTVFLHVPAGWIGPLCEMAADDLAQPGWRNSFGGDSWAEAAYCNVRLFRATVEFCQSPGKAKWDGVLRYLNQTINACHNMGQVLNKWCETGVFNTIAAAPGYGFMNTAVGRLALGVYYRPPKGIHERLSEIINATPLPTRADD